MRQIRPGQLALALTMAVIAALASWADTHMFGGAIIQASGVTFAVAALIDEPW